METVTIDQIKSQVGEYCSRRRNLLESIKAINDSDLAFIRSVIDYKNQTGKTNEEIDSILTEAFKHHEEVFSESMYNATFYKLEHGMIDFFERKTKDEMVDQIFHSEFIDIENLH